MDKYQVELVQTSFEKVAPLGEAVAELFYAELFAIDPTLRGMFKSDMSEQGRKLITALALVVRGLDNPDAIIPAAQNLGVKHVEYGVKAEHYPVVGQALLTTLEKGLGEDFTDETRDAWATAYNLLSTVMCEAAYGKAAA